MIFNDKEKLHLLSFFGTREISVGRVIFVQSFTWLHKYRYIFIYLTMIGQG